MGRPGGEAGPLGKDLLIVAIPPIAPIAPTPWLCPVSGRSGWVAKLATLGGRCARRRIESAVEVLQARGKGRGVDADPP